LSSRLLSLFARFALLFEPISPPFISFWLQRRLRNWKSRGLVDDYRVSTTRSGKFHYKIEVDLDLNSRQAKWVLADILVRLLKRLGR